MLQRFFFTRSPFQIGVFVLGLVLVSLLPVGRLIQDWVSLLPVLRDSSFTAPAQRGYDWVRWEDRDGQISAEYVFPRGPAYQQGLRTHDALYTIEYQQYFKADDVKQAVKGIAPGDRRLYWVKRDDFLEIEVQFSSYPTFLYPLSNGLWQASIWGFMLGAFIHLLALFIVGPLSFRSRTARLSFFLILASAIWVSGNLIRILMINIIGPPDLAGPVYDLIFDLFTLVSFAGWIGFPALLLHKILSDWNLFKHTKGWLLALVYLPPVVFAAGAFISRIYPGWIAPITFGALVGPILFYVCCYIAAATGLNLVLSLAGGTQDPGPSPSNWSRVGSVLVFLVAVLGALSIFGVVPLLGTVTDTAAGWLVVAGQLFCVAPVLLVSVATLKYGKVDQVLTRALTYLTILGSVFFAFVAGMALISPYFEHVGLSQAVGAGLYVVLLLFVFERLSRHVRGYTRSFFMAERQKRLQKLGRFAEQMRTITSPTVLAQKTIQEVGEAFQSQSARLFLHAATPEEEWVEAAYQPEPPFLTLDTLHETWPHIVDDGRVWAHNVELNESTLPQEINEALISKGADLIIPILDDQKPFGLLVLGRKSNRRAVYNLEDVDLLRTLCNQLALAIERLNYLEREKALIRTTAESRLEALRAQINPHFLFNTLNTITAFIEEQPKDAVKAVGHLSAIFRHILQTRSRPFISLKGETKLINHYLSIEQMRFSDRLKVEWAMDPGLMSIPIPAFALQTLVENAVEHGLSKKRLGGTLSLSSTLHHETLAELKVQDTGIGLPALFGQGEVEAVDQPFMGTGLRNVSARLVQIYGRTDLLRFSSNPEQGTTVRMLIPLTGSDGPSYLNPDPEEIPAS